MPDKVHNIEPNRHAVLPDRPFGSKRPCDRPFTLGGLWIVRSRPGRIRGYVDGLGAPSGALPDRMAGADMLGVGLPVPAHMSTDAWTAEAAPHPPTRPTAPTTTR